MADAELVINPKMLRKATRRKPEEVILDEEYTESGAHPKFLVWALTGADYNLYQDSLRVYENGYQVGVDVVHDDLKFLAFCIRDAYNNRLWEDLDEAIAFLGEYEKSSQLKLLAAAQRMNGGAATKKQKEAAEANLERTPTASSNGTSPSPSDASTPESSTHDSNLVMSTSSS